MPIEIDPRRAAILDWRLTWHNQLEQRCRAACNRFQSNTDERLAELSLRQLLMPRNAAMRDIEDRLRSDINIFALRTARDIDDSLAASLERLGRIDGSQRPLRAYGLLASAGLLVVPALYLGPFLIVGLPLLIARGPQEWAEERQMQAKRYGAQFRETIERALISTELPTEGPASVLLRLQADVDRLAREQLAAPLRCNAHDAPPPSRW